MCLPLITLGGHRAYKKSKKEGHGVFIEQFAGGHTQWISPVNETDTDGGEQVFPDGSEQGSLPDGSELVFPPNAGPIGLPPQLDGQGDIPFGGGGFPEGVGGIGVGPQPFGGGGLPGGVGGISIGPQPFGVGGLPGGVGGIGIGPQPFGFANEGMGLAMPYVHGGDDGITGGHQGPVFAANPFIGPGTALTNWFLTTPDAFVKPWSLHPARPQEKRTKKRKAFVVRRERPEEAVHRNGTAGPYPTVKGLGEFRGGRFY